MKATSMSAASSVKKGKMTDEERTLSHAPGSSEANSRTNTLSLWASHRNHHHHRVSPVAMTGE
jgi:hypothetical protein